MLGKGHMGFNSTFKGLMVPVTAQAAVLGFNAPAVYT